MLVVMSLAVGCADGVCSDACDFYVATASCRDVDVRNCSHIQKLDVTQLGGFYCNAASPFAGVPVLNLTGWQERLPKSLKGLFANYAGSEVHGLEAWDVSAVTNMNELFMGQLLLTKTSAGGMFGWYGRW